MALSALETSLCYTFLLRVSYIYTKALDTDYVIHPFDSAFFFHPIVLRPSRSSRKVDLSCAANHFTSPPSAPTQPARTFAIHSYSIISTRPQHPAGRFLHAMAAALGLKTFGIGIAAGLLVLMVLYVAYAGTRRTTRGQSGRRVSLRGGARGRRAQDAETGNGTARRHCQSLESVDTLPRYTPAGEGGVAPPEQVHGSGEHDRAVEGEGLEPPPYSFDAGSSATGKVGYDGDARGWPHGESHVGLPVSPDPVHTCG